MNVCEQTFHISLVCISQNVKGILMWNLQHIKICISVPLIFEPTDNIYYQMIIQETLLWFILDKYLGIFLSLAVVFISSHNLFHHRFFQYLNSFRFEEFPSVLWSIAYLNDNKQITFNYFFRILLTKSRTSLKFVTNKLFLLNTSEFERHCLKKEV